MESKAYCPHLEQTITADLEIQGVIEFYIVRATIRTDTIRQIDVITVRTVGQFPTDL